MPNKTFVNTRSDSSGYENSPLEMVQRRETVDRVASDVERLKSDLREPFKLYYFECWTVKRIAKRFKRTTATIQNRLRTAERKLRYMIEGAWGSNIAKNRVLFLERGVQNRAAGKARKRPAYQKAPPYEDVALQLVSDLQLAIAEESAEEALRYVSELKALSAAVVEHSKLQSE